MHAKTFLITVALATLLPAALAAQQPGVNWPPPAPAAVSPPPVPVPAPGAGAADRPEVHDVYRRRTDERGQRPRRQRRHLRQETGQRRGGGIPPLLGPDGNVRAGAGPGQPAPPRPAPPMPGFPEPSKPAPDPPPG